MVQKQTTKTIGMKTNQNIYENDNEWCSCDNPDYDNVKFFDDGEHEKLHKHHYRCTCGKILQIG